MRGALQIGHLVRRGRGWAGVVGVLVAVSASVLTASAAGAHSEQVTLRVVEQTKQGAEVQYQFRLVHFDDGHPAPGARLLLSATGPDGTTLGPFELMVVDDEAGLHGTTVTFPAPGLWEVHVETMDGAEDMQIRQSVDATTTTVSVTSLATDTVRLDDGGGGSRRGLLVGLVVAVAGIVGFLVLRRKPSAHAV